MVQQNTVWSCTTGRNVGITERVNGADTETHATVFNKKVQMLQYPLAGALWDLHDEAEN